MWLLVFGARLRPLSQSSTAIALTELSGTSAQRGLMWFLICDLYDVAVECLSGISSFSYLAITASKFTQPIAYSGPSALIRKIRD